MTNMYNLNYFSLSSGLKVVSRSKQNVSRHLSVLVFLLGLCSFAHSQISLTLQANDSAAIPGSKRSFYANLTGTTNQNVNWTVNGGCSLSSSTGTPVVVTAPSTGGKCVSSPTNLISFSSPVSCSITATAQDESQGVKTASTTLPVCAPDVMLSVFPQTTVLYSGQTAVIQSDLRGSVDTAVTWAITTNPGAAGSITSGSKNRHAIFSATAAGTYVLTATSVAEPSKTASSTIYVTKNALPTGASVDHTEPVDCTAVGSGNIYEVGPNRAYADLNQVPWPSVGAGDTVRIHNDDLTGQNPTTYHQRIAIQGTGNATQPLRVCGVSDAHGIKPIIDGSSASTRPDENWANSILEPLGVVTLYDYIHRGDAAFDQNNNVIIEGLHIRNANPSFNFLSQNGSVAKPYNAFATCLWVQTGQQILVRGNELDHCSQSIFTNSTTPEAALVQDVTVEGNYSHDFGLVNDYGVHGMYLQSIGLSVQFNYFGTAAPGAMGNIVKSRSVLNFLRWNYISQPVITTARAFDLVEPQAFNCYVVPQAYAKAYHGTQGSDCGQPYSGTDSYSADQVAANYEAFHSDYVYGNVMDDSGSPSGYIHYGYDQQTAEGPAYYRRGGTLFSWNNTHLSRQMTGQKIITETSTPDQGHSYEFPTIQSINNIYSTAPSSTVSFMPTYSLYQTINLDSNWMTAGYSQPWKVNADTFMGAASLTEIATCSIYGSCDADNGHLVWSRNNVEGTSASALYTGTVAPFDLSSFLPTATVQGLSATLPAAIADQPSNMEFFPTTNTIALRNDETFLGALDTNGAPVAPAAVVSTPTPTTSTTPISKIISKTPARTPDSPAAPTTPIAATMVVNPTATATVTQGTALPVAVNLSGKNGVPTGVISYAIDAGSYSMPISSTGINSFTVPSTLAVGAHSIAVVYNGDSKYALGSPMQKIALTVTKPVAVAATMVVNPTAAATVTQGTAFPLTVNLSGSNGVPTGVIKYTIDSTAFNVPVNSTGVTTFAIPGTVTAGPHTIAVAYSGDSKYALGAATQKVSLTITKAPAKTGPVAATMIVNPIATATISEGTALPVSVTLSGKNGVPTGVISYAIDGGSYSMPVSSTGVNSFTVPANLTAGVHYVAVVYSGDSRYALGAAMQKLTLTVTGKTESATAATMIVNPVAIATVSKGSALPISVSLSGKNGVPTGVISYAIDAGFYSMSVSATGLNSFTVPANLAAGVHSIAVVYSGDSKYPLGSPMQKLTLNVTN